VAPYVVRHMLDQCERVIVADNRSSDRSRSLLEGLRNPRLQIVDERSNDYHQAATMQRLIDVATDATWVVPFDFDEWWYSDDGRIADVLRRFPGDQTAARTIDMIPQPSDADDPNPFRRIVWGRPDGFYTNPDYRKVAFRPGSGRHIMQGNHGVMGTDRPPYGPLRIRHYPFRSYEQAAAKLRHGKGAVSRGSPPGTGLHWLEWGGYPDAKLRRWWAEWTDPKGLVR
jgi:hypothetical protein